MLMAEDFLISFVVAEAGAEASSLGACGLHIPLGMNGPYQKRGPNK
jgi:hypothetical protein